MSWINKNWKALTVVGGILGVSAYASKYFDVEPVDDFGAETQTFEAPKPRLSKKQQETLDYIKEATMRTGRAYITGETYNMRVIKNLFDKKLIKFHPEDEQYKNNWKRPSRVIEADGVYYVVPTKLGNEYRYKFPYGNYQYSSREEWLKNQEPVFDGTTQTLDEVLDELFGAEAKGKYLPYKKSNSRFADEKHENMNERLVDLGFGRTNYFPDEGKSWTLPFDLPVHHDFYEDENGENRSVLAQVSPHDAALIISNIKPADRNKIIAIILGYNDYEDEGKIMLDYPDVEITDEIVGLESDVVSMLLQVGKITDFRGNTLDEEELYRFGDEDFGAESTLPKLTPKQMDFLRYSSWARAYEAYATGIRTRGWNPREWKEDYTICYEIRNEGYGNEVARKTLQSLLEKKVVKATDTSYVRQDGRIRKSYAEQVNENPSLVKNITQICLVLTPIGLEILKRMFARNFKDVVGWKIELTFPSGETAYLHDVPNDIGKSLDSHIGDVKWDSQTERFGAEDFGADEDYYEDYIQRIFTFIDEQVGTEYFPSIEDEEEVARFKKGFYDEFDEVGQAIEDANDFSWRKVFGADEDDEEYLRYRYGEPLENMSISRKLESVASSLKDLTSEDMLFTVINNLSTKQANQLINRLYAGIREGSIRRKPFRHNMRMGAESESFESYDYYTIERDDDWEFDEAYMEKQDAERIMELLKIVRRKATGSNARYAKNYAREAKNAYYQYGMKGLKVQVAYVLSNLGGWRGDEAKEVKAELRKLTK